MTRQFANAVSTTLSSSMTNVQTTMVVASATGFPASFPFDAHIEAEGANTDEIVSITSLSSGTTYNVTRASESYAGSSSASAHASGANVRLVITAGAVGSGGLVLLEEHTAANSPSLDFTTFISPLYDTYLFEGVELAPGTAAADLLMEMGASGPIYDTAVVNYEFAALLLQTGAGTTVDTASATAIPRIFKSMSADPGYGFGVFSLTVTGLQSTVHRKVAHGTIEYVDSLPACFYGFWGMDWLTTGTAAAAVRFIMSAGNIASGTIRVYGIAKS